MEIRALTILANVLAVAIVLASAVGCLNKAANDCGDGTTCPIDKVCIAGGGCAFPQQLVACNGLVDGSPCTFGTPGQCRDGVCFPSGCGDDMVTAPEDCDGSVGTASCTMFGYYNPDGLACSSVCKFDVAGCRGICGDGVVNGPEACDGAALDHSCADYGFEIGAVSCSTGCLETPSTCEALGWSVEGPPDSLEAVWANAPDDVFAVGTFGRILHFDGLQWRQMPSQTASFLYAVWGSGPTDVWAAGAPPPNQSGYPAVLHYNGVVWSTVDLSVVDPSLMNNDVRGIWGSSASDVYFVGPQSAILHWNGTTLESQPTGIVATMSAVWGSGPDDIYAVGHTVLHNDGTGWTEYVEQNPISNIAGVWGTGPDNVYAIGTRQFYHLDGTQFDLVKSFAVGVLYSTWGSGSSDIYVSGSGTTGSVFHFDGASWTPSDLVGSVRGFGGLGSRDVYAVGDAGIQHYQGTSLTTPSSGTTQDLYDVWAGSPTDVFAVGAAGTIVRDGVAMTVGTDDLLGVWGSSSTDVFAVGVNGTIVHFDGLAWSAMISGTTEQLADIWGSGPTDVFAVGGPPGAAVLHYDGVSWTPMDAGTVSMQRIWGTGPTDVFAVGYDTNIGAVIVHYDGVAWTPMQAELNDYVEGIWGSGPGDVFVVGRLSGMGLHYDGAAWGSMPMGLTGDLRAVTGTSAQDIYVAGANSDLNEIVLHDHGTGWSELPVLQAASSPYLNGAFALPGHVWFVGDTGAMFHLRRDSTACATPIPAEQCGNDVDDDCDGLIDCADPDCASTTFCARGGACQDTQTIACGDTVSGTTVGADAHRRTYRCDGRPEPGPEVMYRLVTPTAGTVTATLSGFVNDLDLIALGQASTGTCDPDGACLRSSSTTNPTETVSFSSAANQTSYLVVDGADAGAFTLTVSCP